MSEINGLIVLVGCIFGAGLAFAYCAKMGYKKGMLASGILFLVFLAICAL